MNLKIPSEDTLAIIMGGGAGTRLFPLTQKRAKPAVPLAGKYRLVDIPISNCLNSGFRQVYVLTQFNSESLHRHITATYKFFLNADATQMLHKLRFWSALVVSGCCV